MQIPPKKSSLIDVSESAVRDHYLNSQILYGQMLLNKTDGRSIRRRAERMARKATKKEGGK
jgi:hypothetical protein